jgi:hypothetical protein
MGVDRPKMEVTLAAELLEKFKAKFLELDKVKAYRFMGTFEDTEHPKTHIPDIQSVCCDAPVWIDLSPELYQSESDTHPVQCGRCGEAVAGVGCETTCVGLDFSYTH